MTNDEQQPDAAAEGQTDVAAADTAAEEAAGTAADTPAEESMEDALLRLNAQVAELDDRNLRALAETENIRRRAARDVENARKFALEKFISDLLPVVDSLERAVDSAQSTAADGGNQGVEAIAEGVEVARKLFVDTIGKFGVEQIDPLGEPFDPQRHEAMSMIENPNMEPGSVMQVLQRGYALNGRLVRAAMVIVTKAPAGAAGVDETA